MNMENVAKLVTALRSGQYQQGSGRLKYGNRFCCLGVACDISGLGEWEPTSVMNVYRYVVRDENGELVDRDESVLPDPVANWLGINTAGEFLVELTPNNEVNSDPRFFDVGDGPDELYSHSTEYALTELNDEGLTFEQIADFLVNAAVFVWEDAPRTEEEY